MTNEITTIDDKFYKKCKVIRLSTNNASRITIINNELLFSHEVNWQTRDNKWEKGDGINQHLYVLLDEEIKEDNWILYNPELFIGHKPQKVKSFTYSQNKLTINGFNFDDGIIGSKGEYLKIIATTDPALKIAKHIVLPFKQLTKWIHLPRLSNEFIKRYCELGSIDEVLVEYIKVTNIDIDIPDFYQLKVAPDNIITIKAVKEKLYTRDEVIGLLKTILYDADELISFKNTTLGELDRELFNDYIKETLK